MRDVRIQITILLAFISTVALGESKDSRKKFTVEKIRFIKPDVAVVQVRSISRVGNIGTYIFTKDSGNWLVVSFTNVGYELVQEVPR